MPHPITRDGPLPLMNVGENPIEKYLRERRSIRRFLPRQIPSETLLQLIDAARWAPSAHNRQPWRFVIIKKGRNRGQLADTMGSRLRMDLTADGLSAEQIEADCARSRKRIVSAPALVLLCLTMTEMDVYPDDKRSQAEYLMAVQSVAMAGQNLMLAAHGAGLVSCWLCAPLFCPETVQSCLDLPANWQAQGLIALGYAAEERTKARRPTEESIIWR